VAARSLSARSRSAIEVQGRSLAWAWTPACWRKREFAHRDREIERGIRAVVAHRAERIDPHHAPAGIEQRAARIARTNRCGVQDGVEFLGTAPGRDIAARLDRRLRADQIAQREPLRQIDIARIAHRAHIRAIGYLSGIERERGQPSVALDLEQGKVVARRIGDHARLEAAAPLRGNDACNQRVVLPQRIDHMGIGDDIFGGDGKARAMADQRGTMPVALHDDHAHDPTARRRDIGGVGMGGGDPERRDRHDTQGGNSEQRGDEAAQHGQGNGRDSV
jgi:hypothetical protein